MALSGEAPNAAGDDFQGQGSCINLQGKLQFI